MKTNTTNTTLMNAEITINRLAGKLETMTEFQYTSPLSNSYRSKSKNSERDVKPLPKPEDNPYREYENANALYILMEDSNLTDEQKSTIMKYAAVKKQ